MTLSVEPVSPEVWAVIRQSGMRMRDFAYVEDADRVRLASIAMHQAFTGDSTAEPQQIPAQVVMVERVFDQDQGNPDLRADDLILAIELTNPTDGRPVLLSIGSVAQLRDLFSDRLIGKTSGVDHYKIAAEYPVWIARGGEVQKLVVRAKRLFW